MSGACRSTLALCLLAAMGCSDAGDDGDPIGAAGSANGGSGGSGGAAGSEAVAGSAGAATAGSGGVASGGGGAGGGTGGAGGGSGFAERGVCGQRGNSQVTADAFSGSEEYFLISDRGFGDDICVVRFDVTRVGAGPSGCTDCAWTHEIEYANPQVLTDVGGVCGDSELGLDQAKIDEIDGSRVAYGYVYEYSGHVSVIMKYDAATAAWVPNGNATWDEATGAFGFNRRDGLCGY